MPPLHDISLVWTNGHSMMIEVFDCLCDVDGGCVEACFTFIRIKVRLVSYNLTCSK